MPNTHRTLSSVSHIAYSSGKDPVWFCLQLSDWVSVLGEIICSFCIVSFPAPRIILMQSVHIALIFLVIVFTNHYIFLIFLLINHLYCTKHITNRRIFHNIGNFASWISRFSFLLYWAGQRHCNWRCQLSYIRHASNQSKDSS